MKIEIENSKFTGCAYCQLICPKEAIEVHFIANLNENCTGCLKCIKMCPNYAISIVD